MTGRTPARANPEEVAQLAREGMGRNAVARHLGVMSRDVVLAPARNDTVPIQEVSVQTACH